VTCKVGVDISKMKLDAAWLRADGKYRSKVFTNNASGFADMLRWLDLHLPGGKADAHVCMEATGTYHEGLAFFLHDQAVAVSVVNPLQVKRFMQLERVRNKTDEGDAKALARFCDKTAPALWEAPSVGVRSLQALVARLSTLQELRQGEANRLAVAHDAVKPSLTAVIASLDESIRDVRKQIRKTIDDDPDLQQRSELLASIPGLGDKTIPPLLAYIGRPERFTSVKALIAYASLTPMIRQSGTSLDKRRGTHPQGHRALKKALYFPASVRRLADLRVRLDAAQQRQHLALDAVHRFLRVAFEAQHQHRRGVRRAHQPEAVGQSTRRPSMVETFASGKLAFFTSSATMRCGSPSSHFTFSSGVEKLVGSAVEHGARVGMPRQDLQQAAAGIGAVVEAEPALLEEDVAAHLAAQRRIHFASSSP
jgi:transposase